MTAKPAPVNCPICGEPLVTMYRIVDKVLLCPARLNRSYTPFHLCPVCMIGVRTMALPKGKLVTRKRETQTLALPGRRP